MNQMQYAKFVMSAPTLERLRQLCQNAHARAALGPCGHFVLAKAGVQYRLEMMAESVRGGTDRILR